MAHEIMNDNAMFYVGETPWHGLGVSLDIPPSTEEALKLAGLDWEVEKKETMIPINSGVFGLNQQLTPSGYYATYRRDEEGNIVILGHVSERYEVLQNVEAFKPFDEVLLEYGYTYETAGAVKNGKRVWILAKAPKSFLVGDDVADCYALLFNSHDGSTSVILKPTVIRVVCNNTLNFALSDEKVEIAMKHTLGVRDRLDQVTEMLKIAEGNIKEASETWNRMVDIEMSHRQAIEYFEEVLPNLKKRGLNLKSPTGRKSPDFQQPIFDHLIANFVSGHGNNGKNLWHAYNAITEYVDHQKTYRDWVEATQFGNANKVKKRAFAIASKRTEQNAIFVNPMGFSV